MTRKDYEMLAGVVKREVEVIRGLADMNERGRVLAHAKALSVQGMAYNMAQGLAYDNGRFDHVRFYNACGFVVQDNYPLIFTD